MSTTNTNNTHNQPEGSPARPLIYWLGGWGISEQAMLAILCAEMPGATHRVLTPTQDNLALLLSLCTRKEKPLCEQANPDCQIHSAESSTADIPDIIAGYSTGAFLLLRELGRLQAFAHCTSNAAVGSQLPLPLPLLLFAPFADFRAESNLGGRVVGTRLKLLLRRLRTAPLQAVVDFYQQAQITLHPPQSLPYAEDDLIWGIEQLAESAISATTLEQLRATNSAAEYSLAAWIGERDTLLEAGTVATIFAPGVCHVCADASHDLKTLLTAARTTGGLPC